MQTRLDDLGVRQEPKVNLDYVCVNCKLDIAEADLAEYPVVFKSGWRPLLENVVGNIWVCPRCRAMHLDRNFYYGFRRRDEKLECPHCGGRSFRYDKRLRELVCLMCGLVLNS